MGKRGHNTEVDLAALFENELTSSIFHFYTASTPKTIHSLEGSPKTMTEIVGLASGIIALGGTAKVAGKVAKIICGLMRDAKWARKDIRNLELELRRYESSVAAAQFALRKAYKNPSSSEVVGFLELEQFNHLLIQSSKGVNERIRDARNRLPDLGGSPIPAIVKWFIWSLSAKEELMELRPSLESVKTWLDIILQCVEMTLLCKEQGTPELSEQM